MLFFAHTGLTLGITLAIDSLWQMHKGRKVPGQSGNSVSVDAVSVSHPEDGQELERQCQAESLKWPASGSFKIDYRFILLGSLLPDIIDKPVGMLFFPAVFSNGRIFSHTLLFLLLIAAAGIALYRLQKKAWLLYLAWGTLCHLLLDAMWLTPCTLLWPMCGFAFPRYEVEHWLSDILRRLFTVPYTYIPELAGALILIYFFIQLLAKKSFRLFIKNGASGLSH